MSSTPRPPLSPDAVFFLPAPHFADEPPGPKLYFFKGSKFASWDVLNEQLCPGYPRDIAAHFPGFMESTRGRRLRAALQVPQWGRQVFFMFDDGRDLVTWDLELGQVVPETRSIDELLPGIFTSDPVTPVYAELPDKQGVIYAFNGKEFMRWTVLPGGVAKADAGYPRKSADDWKDGLVLAPRCGVYLEWPNRSSAHSNRKIYFFMGDLYLRWDVPSHTRNYRLDIVAGWKGWPSFD